MEKNPRSARFTIPAVNEASSSSASVFSPSRYPPAAAAIHRREPVRTCATSRSFGLVPPVGTPNASVSSSLLNSSSVVPSMPVVSISCQVAPMPSCRSVRAASSSKMCRITCSPSKARALDSAGPDGVTVPGFTGRPGIANVLASTRS
jgi:hypothetical protein